MQRDKLKGYLLHQLHFSYSKIFKTFRVVKNRLTITFFCFYHSEGLTRNSKS